MNAVPSASLARFESQLERAIRRERGRRSGRIARRVVIAAGAAAVVGLGILNVLHENAPSRVQRTTRTHHRAVAPAGRRARPSRGFDKAEYSTRNPKSIWVVVNKQHPLEPKPYVPGDLTPVGNGQYLRAEAAAALEKMLAAAKRAGYLVAPDSGYRSYRYQETVYAGEVSAHGRAEADTVSARLGYSEHQTGWAIDLGSGGCNITACFGTTPGGRWVTANAYRYGFVLRYPAGKMNVTGYRSEPWHFRYVGRPLSSELHKEHVATLEEFFDLSGGTRYR